jgi:putative PIN family toxin of toxin-antitoxin system
MIRVVLDTNVLVSSLLFENGRLAWIRHSWQNGRITPVMAEATTAELLRVLKYPKFRLSSEQIDALMADLLPWSETWLEELPDDQPRCRDPQDQIFLDLAIGAGVQALVSGDKDLLVLAATINIPRILEPEVFRGWLEQESTGAAQGGQDPLVT